MDLLALPEVGNNCAPLLIMENNHLPIERKSHFQLAPNAAIFEEERKTWNALRYSAEKKHAQIA